jgi:hypothetical protein
MLGWGWGLAAFGFVAAAETLLVPLATTLVDLHLRARTPWASRKARGSGPVD